MRPTPVGQDPPVVGRSNDHIINIDAGIAEEWGEPPRATLRREVCTAAAGAATEQEFFTQLRQAGVLVRLRHSVTNPGEVTGYAVGLPSTRPETAG